VTPAELFFDLVFVYAITQVTALLADKPSPPGLLQGVLILCLLWWCWCCFAWLGNVVRADTGLLRLILFTVMALMLVIAVTVPESYQDKAGGLHGPTVFVVCYAGVRLLQLSTYWASDPGNRELQRVLLRTLASCCPPSGCFSREPSSAGWRRSYCGPRVSPSTSSVSI
jgi:low temperature requirement protein LtrA